jgi:hypothetical protein
MQSGARAAGLLNIKTDNKTINQIYIASSNTADLTESAD